tara:strand:+ start:177 stop:935 length:759 start_codon:yes stop_codon:yes gene_type:complete
MKHVKYIGAILLCFIVTVATSQNEALFEQGKEAYKAEEYTQAVTAWTQILENNAHSASLYFNLGNAHYKLNQIGPSIYYYEKALQLSPGDPDIKNNLAFAKNATVDVIEPLPTTFFNKWYQRMVQFAAYETWAWGSVALAFLFAATFLLYYFTYREQTKRIWFIVSVSCLLFLIVSLSLAFVVKGEDSAKRAAIVFAEEVVVRTGPTMGSDATFTLHEGTKVRIIAEEGAWIRITIADGKDGWLTSSDVKEL